MRLTKRIKIEIEAHAQRSLYKLNAGSTDCYAFNLCHTSKGKLDFIGGWDWSKSLVDTKANYLYMLESKEFIKLEKAVI